MSTKTPAPATPASAAAPAPMSTPPATPALAAAPKGGHTPEPPAPGTTSRLFPGWDGGKPPVAPASVPKTPPPAAPPAPVPDVLDPATLLGKKLKIKVGDEEKEVTFDDILKGVQLESHLTSKAQDLSTREHELNEREKAVRKQLEEIIPHLKPAAPAAPKGEDPLKDSLIADDPLTKALLARLDAQDKLIQQLTTAAAPTVYEQNLKRLAGSIEKETGYKDFMDYKPRIEELLRKLPKEQRAAYDTEEWWSRQFFILKSQDLAAEIVKAKTPAPAAPPPPSRPAAAPIAGIGGSDGGPAAPPVSDDWDLRYNAAFEKAQKSGATADWLAVLRLKEEAKTSR